MNVPRSVPRGFRILRPLELLNWRSIAITPAIPLEDQSRCPACGEPLANLALLGGERAAIRVGTCRICGYVGYRDRPTREWISRYYAEVWSHGAEKDTAKLAAKRPRENLITASLRSALTAISDRNRPVLEIGAGYGTMLRAVRDAGFASAIGIESSHTRAETARQATGLAILEGDFESPAIQAELIRRAPFGLIYLFHVLEHTYRPAEIIAAASRLQSPGDLLLIGVPNLAGEPAMNILLFLPHLHSFTLTALTSLLNRASYTIIEAGFSDAVNLNVIARKRVHTATPPTMRSAIEEKFHRELRLAALRAHGRQRYFWSKKDAGRSGIEPYHWYWQLQDRLASRRNIRSLIIEPLANTTPPETPFTLAFAHQLFLYIK